MSKPISKAFDRHARQKKERLRMQRRCSHAELVLEPGVLQPCYTYRALRDYLSGLDDDQLEQQVQLLNPGGSIDDSILLEPVIGAGTVAQMCSTEEGEAVQQIHSALDFEHHPEQIVLISDYSPFSEDGDSHYELQKDADGEIVLVGNKSGKVHDVVERKRCEPSIKASRTSAMTRRSDASDEELMQRQEALAVVARVGWLSSSEQSELDAIQAELYRRLYALPQRGV